MYIGFSAAISGVLGYLAAMVGAQLVSRFGQNKILFLGAFSILSRFYSSPQAYYFLYAPFIYSFL